MKLELKAPKQRVREQEEEIDELYENMDTLEQYTRKNSLEIKSIPENVCNDGFENRRSSKRQRQANQKKKDETYHSKIY